MWYFTWILGLGLAVVDISHGLDQPDWRLLDEIRESAVRTPVAFGGGIRRAEHAVKAIALGCDRVIVETDCPYLAPVPMRGRRNEPAFLPHIYDKLAEIRASLEPEERSLLLLRAESRLSWREIADVMAEAGEPIEHARVGPRRHEHAQRAARGARGRDADADPLPRFSGLGCADEHRVAELAVRHAGRGSDDARKACDLRCRKLHEPGDLVDRIPRQMVQRGCCTLVVGG